MHSIKIRLCFLSLIFISSYVCAQQVRVSVISTSIANLPMWVADKKGFFKDEGLDVVYSISQNSDYQLEMLASGGFEFVHQPVDNFIREIERGSLENSSDFVIIHAINGLTHDLISRPGLSTFADLKGKIYALDDVETGYALLYRKVLQKYGLNYPGDYTLLPELGGSQNRLKALYENRAQFTHMNPPHSTLFEKDGFHILTTLSDHYPNFPSSSIGTRREWAEDNRDTVIAYLRAYIRAGEWCLDPANREEIIDISAAIGHDRALLPGIVDRHINQGMVRYGTLTEEGINQVGNMLVEGKVIDTFGSMEKYTDTSFQLEAKRQFLEKGL